MNFALIKILVQALHTYAHALPKITENVYLLNICDVIVWSEFCLHSLTDWRAKWRWNAKRQEIDWVVNEYKWKVHWSIMRTAAVTLVSKLLEIFMLWCAYMFVYQRRRYHRYERAIGNVSCRFDEFHKLCIFIFWWYSVDFSMAIYEVLVQ